MSDINDTWDDDEDRDQFAVTVVEQCERANEYQSPRAEVESLRQQLSETEEFCKGEMARSRERSSRLRQQLAAQAAQIALLRDAVAKAHIVGGQQAIDEALAIQPDDALAAVTERVKEQCAAVCESLPVKE